MKNKLSLVLALVLTLSCVLCAVPARAAADVSAQCAVLLDEASGRFLYQKNADERMLIASTTKVMTALVIIERCRLDDVVTIPAECVGVEGSSMYLKEDEQITVRELLYGLLLLSGNDAAAALAVHCAGSIGAFAALMNERADTLGLTNSHFANPHGLNDNEHFSSARDLAVIAREALGHEVFREIVSTKTISVAGRSMQNHNKLLWNYEGAVGVKTGYTMKAGRCLVSAAERDGRMLIAVTLKAPDDWNDHAALFDMGFSRYENRTLVQEGAVLGVVPVVSGQARSVPVRAERTLSVPLSDDELARVEVKMERPWFVWAPVQKDAAAGRVKYLLDGRLLAETPLLYAAEAAEFIPPEKSIWERIGEFWEKLFG